MRIRGIFRPSPATRLRTPLALAGGIGALALVLSVVVPRDLFGSAPGPAAPSLHSGEGRVLDDATLRLGEQVLRLHALQVPERGWATCRDQAGRTQDCAAAAADALARLVAVREVTCHVQGRDRRGRAFGRCEAGGVELSASLVAEGWAVVDAAAAPSLVIIEARARQGARGLWATGGPALETLRRRS